MLRSARKTSASSMRTTQPQVLPRYRTDLAEIQNRLEILLGLFWVGSYVTTGNAVQRFLRDFCNTFGREGLAGPWAAVEQDDEAVSFAVNHIGATFIFNVMVDERVD